MFFLSYCGLWNSVRSIPWLFATEYFIPQASTFTALSFFIPLHGFLTSLSLMPYFLSKGLSKRLRSEKLAAFSGTSGICFPVKASYGTITLACFFFSGWKKCVFKSRDWIRSTQNTREARISLAANTGALRLVLWKGYIRMLGWKEEREGKKRSDTRRSTKSCWAEPSWDTLRRSSASRHN